MKFRGDDRELLRSLWSAVQSAGGSPSVNMIQKMARLAGASFDDKAARAVLAGDGGNTSITMATPHHLNTITKATPKRNVIRSNDDANGNSSTGAAQATPQYLSIITEATPKQSAAINNVSDSSVRPDAVEASPRYLSAITEAMQGRKATIAGNDASSAKGRIGATEATPQYISSITNASPKFGFGENDETMLVDAPAPNLFDGLVDPLKLEPANDDAPQELLAPGIARLMELAKKAKAVNAAAAIRAEEKAPPKAIRYIFPSERKL